MGASFRASRDEQGLVVLQEDGEGGKDGESGVLWTMWLAMLVGVGCEDDRKHFEDASGSI